MWGEVPEAVKDQGFQIFTYKELIDLGKRNTKAEARIPVARRDDIAALLYTSGTTGKPKGVPLTHDNVLHQVSTWPPKSKTASHVTWTGLEDS